MPKATSALGPPSARWDPSRPHPAKDANGPKPAVPAPADTREYGVFIVDDHEVIRGLLSEYIGTEPGLRVCGTAASGAEALERIGQAPCDLALVDITMPGMDGIELVRRLRARRPDVACLMLSSHISQRYVEAAIEAGAHGYTTKEEPDLLIEAIWRVLRGEHFLSEEVRRLNGAA